MPSPIAHTAVGYVLYKIYYADSAQPVYRRLPKNGLALISVIALSLLPDLDVIPALFFGNISYFHNNFTHSLGCGIMVAVIIGVLVQVTQGGGFKYWFIFALLSYELHVIMDYFTIGRGVMLLWPISDERYEPAIKLFYGLRRSNGLLTLDHLWTIGNEIFFVTLLLLLNRWYTKLKALFV